MLHPIQTLCLEEICQEEQPDLSSLPETFISLDLNRFYDFDSSFLPPRIEYISLRSNFLRSDTIHFHIPLLHLHSLYLDHNNLTYVDNTLFMCPNLKHLSLIGNAIGRMHNFFHLPLETLCLDKNPIQILDNLPPTLKKLSAKHCHIRMIQSRLPEGMQHINLSENKLRYAGLPLNWGKALQTLDLGFNRIQRFPKSLPDTLRTINLERNNLETIPSILPKSLVSLNLTRNKVFALPKESNIYLALGALNENHLIELVAPSWIKIALMEKNWNTDLHHSHQKKIRALWKRYILRKRLRIYMRAKRIYSELLEVALSPEHILQTDVFSPEWGNLLASRTTTTWTTTGIESIRIGLRIHNTSALS